MILVLPEAFFELRHDAFATDGNRFGAGAAAVAIAEI